jgi:hypothetical protein
MNQGDKTTKVVNVHKPNLIKMGYKDMGEWVKDPNNVYIGRNNPYIEGATGSKYQNTFKVDKYGRDRCLELYEQSIRSNPTLMNQIEELRGKTLGCWCHPLGCHGDILIKILNEKN